MGCNQVTTSSAFSALNFISIHVCREYWSAGGATNLIEREGQEEEGWVFYQNSLKWDSISQRFRWARIEKILNMDEEEWFTRFTVEDSDEDLEEDEEDGEDEEEDMDLEE